MLDTKTKNRLEHIIEHCDKIIGKINTTNKEGFNNNEVIVSYCAFHIIQIGELANQISYSALSKIENVEWKKIIGMRNVVVHAYGTIDENILWETCKYQVEELKKTIINSLETDKE